MQAHRSVLDWIAAQHSRMCRRVIDWSKINSGTANLAGLAAMAEVLKRELASLGGEIREHALPPMVSIDRRGQAVQSPLGRAISIVKRPQAARRVFLAIHMDTVYSADDPFQTGEPTTDGKLHGPGVADAKGGLAVMLTTLEAFEQSSFANALGWEVLINPDEEIGSPGSGPLFAKAAGRNHLGLLFEPALANGALVDRRKGSGNFAIVVRGRSAHAGRDFAQGRSAIVAASELTLALHALNAALPGVTVNIGAIDGGSPANVVPDLAICRVNVRTTEAADELRVRQALDRLLADLNSREGIAAELHGGFASPPKIPDARGRALLDAAIACGRDLGMQLECRASGGACDGNRLAAAGLPNIDSLGVCGGEIHSPGEFVILDSLVQRAQLTALLLMKLASGDIPAASVCR